MILSKNRKNSRTSARKAAVSLLMIFVSGMFFMMPQTAHADAWGANMAAAIMKQTMEQIARQIEGALLGSLKMAAVQMLNNQVGQLIGGGAGGQARFITSFDDFLYRRPQQRTDLYMNSFFTLTTRGKGAQANYIGIGDMGGIGGSYASYLQSVGKQAIVGKGTIGTLNLEEYTASPQAMFAEGDFRAFNAFFSNPYNNPYGYSLKAEEANQIIAAASNPGELASGVIAAMANKVVSGLVTTGIGQVQANFQRQIGGVNRQVGSALKQATGILGPAG